MDLVSQIIVIMAALAFVFQVLAAIYAFRVGKKLGHSLFWSLLIAAIGLMAFRRLATAGYALGTFGSYEPLVQMLDSSIIPLAVSTFFLAGMYSLYRRLQAHEFVDRPVKRR
jgi:hypothetical protein